MYWHQTSADPTHVRTLQKPGHVAARPLYHVDLLQLLDAVFLKRTLRGKKEDAHLYRQANALLMMYGVWRMSCGSSRSKALRVLMIAHKDIVRASSQGEREVSDQSKVRNIVGRSGRDTQASYINPCSWHMYSEVLKSTQHYRQVDDADYWFTSWQACFCHPLHRMARTHRRTRASPPFLPRTLREVAGKSSILPSLVSAGPAQRPIRFQIRRVYNRTARV
jgi:hypothetical protein